jgi:ATP-dependent Lon protease
MSEKDLISAIDDDSVIDDSSGVPVLPLRDVVVYPHMVIPLFVGRERSIVALNKAMDAGKRILLVAQKAADLDDPQPADLYDVGTLATILQLLKLPDGTVKVLVEGGERALIDRFNVEDHFSAEITPLAEDDRHDEREIDVLVRSIITQFEQYVKLNKKVPPEAVRHR